MKHHFCVIYSWHIIRPTAFQSRCWRLCQHGSRDPESWRNYWMWWKGRNAALLNQVITFLYEHLKWRKNIVEKWDFLPLCNTRPRGDCHCLCHLSVCLSMFVQAIAQKLYMTTASYFTDKSTLHEAYTLMLIWPLDFWPWTLILWSIPWNCVQTIPQNL